MENKNTNVLLQEGTILKGTYKIINHLASGGFGNTYLAMHLTLGKNMVLKEFYISGVTIRENDNVTVSVSHPDNKQLFENQKRKFKKEAQRMFDLSNKHIVQVYDLFEENNTIYYAMEFVDGLSLNKLMQEKQRPFTEAEVRSILGQMLDAMDAIHQKNIWHLDIKPGNILMDKDGNCTLIDFGSSKQTDQSGGSTTSTALSYTPGYAPPEQVNGSDKRWGPWTDFYALGATLYNLLSYKKPPLSDSILDEGNAAFAFPGNVSGQMRQLISWMMQPSSSLRPESVDAVRSFLANDNDSGQTVFAGGAPYLSHNYQSQQTEATTYQQAEATVYQPTNDKKNKSKLIPILASVAGLLALLFVGFLLFSGNNKGSQSGDIVAENTTVEKKQEVPETPQVQEVEKEAEPVPEVYVEEERDASGSYWGSIAGQRVELQVNQYGNSISGRIRYTKYGHKWMDVYGTISDNGSASLTENYDGMESGYYNGTFKGSKFSGTFVNYKGTSYHFSLKR